MCMCVCIILHIFLCVSNFLKINNKKTLDMKKYIKLHTILYLHECMNTVLAYNHTDIVAA